MKKVLESAFIMLAVSMIITGVAVKNSFADTSEGTCNPSCTVGGQETGKCIISNGVKKCSATASEGDPCSGTFTPTC